LRRVVVLVSLGCPELWRAGEKQIPFEDDRKKSKSKSKSKGKSKGKSKNRSFAALRMTNKKG